MMSKRIKHVDTLFSNNKLHLEMENEKRINCANDFLHPIVIKWLNEYKEVYPDKQTHSFESLYSFLKTKMDDNG